jgi:lactate racemase-like protein
MVALTKRLLIVRQHFPSFRIADVAAEARRQLDASGFATRVRPGARIAIGVGSRGIANIATIVRSVVDYWLGQSTRPFIFPAMGSHGAATAEGQAHVLEQFGITESAMACPIVSRVDVVALGTTQDGIDVFMDAAAHAADAVMLVGRVKWHTNFNGAIESGLVKMMAIGVGKFAGAQRYHAHGRRLGMEHVIRTVGEHVRVHANIIGGLAILEDAHHDTAKLDAVPVEEMVAREEQNLALVKSWMPRLPCDVDVLIVDEIGKDISGTGMDAKVVNRGPLGEYNFWPGLPQVERLFVRELSPLTYGNANGIGLADVTTDRLVRQIDWQPTSVNALSAGTPSRIRVPLHFPSDRECLEWVAGTVGKSDRSDVTIGWIKNTLQLDRLVVSRNLKDQIASQSDVTVESEVDWEWNDDGNLRSWV